jgi:hypothetical membrane protein
VGDPREDGAPDPGPRPTASTVRAAGALLFAAGATTILGIITAEALFPGSYSTGANEISDLGGRAGQDGPVSSATIFNGALVTAGLLTLGAALALWRASADRVLAGLLAVLAAGLVAVGLLPGGTGWTHQAAALVVFVAGGSAALASGRSARPPFRYLAFAIGAASLIVLVVYLVVRSDAPLPGLGVGGLERWVAYPLLLWCVGFGGYLMGAGRTTDPPWNPGRPSRP